MQSRSHNTIAASWPFVSFCGISPPAYIDSVQYILEIAQGVEYKPGYLSRFISDVCAVDYRTVCAGPNIGSTTIQGLLPARWYHLRLSIEYLGQRFVSESQAIHTPTWVPSAPGMPRVNVLPVLSSFDLKSDVPVRLDMAICWNPSSPHGQPITQYQCHIQKFNALGYVVQSCGAAARKEKHNRLRTFYQAPERDPRANQWTQSPGRSAVQIHNSIVLADRSPTRGRTAQARTASRTSSHSNAHSQSPERLLPDVNGHMHDSSFATHSAATTPEERRFKWEIVYDNILTNVKCTSPEADHAEWHIRVRAKNGNGWSDFSPVLKMNGLSHPSLFTLPPPVNAFGTCYYTEHASGQYLDGNAAEQFRHSNDPQQHPHPQGLGPESGMLRSDGINVRNELFLHPRSVAAKSSPKRTAKTPNTLKREDNEARAKQLMDSMGGGTGSGKMGSLGSSGLSGKSGDSIKQAPAKLHVLHFKEGNAWENTHSSSLGSLGSFSAAAVDTPTSTQNEFSSTLPTMSMKKSDSLLPSLGASARMGSSKALFSKG